ncbi:uncharacterized protein [Battus philenor]|uniref:uncharacterized protein n=1 Tax=Battus philenor TaxID=42288 RepID=UPI0035D0F411
MFCCIFTLLLINTFYHSLGYPTSSHVSTLASSLDNSLQTLAGRCKNQFLITQINDKISECNLTVPLTTIRHMQCLIFYDMSTQLCDAVVSAKLNQSEDFTKDQLKVIKVDEMCKEIARNWKFTNLTNMPQYLKMVENVFNDEEQCRKVCEVPDLMIDDTNYFCKFYKWGSDVLKVLPITPRVDDKTNIEVLTVGTEQNSSIHTKEMSSLPVNNSIISTIKNNNVDNNEEVRNFIPSGYHTTLKNLERADNEGTKLEDIQPVNMGISGADINSGIKKDEISAGEALNNIEQSVDAPKPDVSLKTNMEVEVPPKKDDIDKDQLLNGQGKDNKEAFDDAGEDADSEEEDKQDMQDDMEISIGKDDLQKLEEEKIKENTKSNVPFIPSYTVEKSHGEFISKIPQDDFPEDDDHFFSFFLTAVIVVVLLYILYHNKSKFTKVVLGLIVEGRQPGRRRNSRGHAYRRLDTLEQAMSTNSPAPPSKIIY